MTRTLQVLALLASGFCLAAQADTQLTEEPWGRLADGSAVTRYTLTNASGARASFIPLGAAIVAVEVPDRSGKLADVVLGYDSAADYGTGNGPYMGLTIGRYANRIFGTDLKIGDEHFTLTGQPNRDGTPGSVILHGGPGGFSSRMWSGERVVTGEGTGVRFTLESPDGDQGFPGRMQASVTYHWTDAFELIVTYDATTTKPTVASFTQHSYFNLAGAGNGDIQDHLLQINADFFTFALPDNKPTGEIRAVQGTPFDFTVAKPIGRDIDADDAQMKANRGYNQNFVLRRSLIPGTLSEAAVLKDLPSGRVMTVLTSEPGLFLYTANFIDTQRKMKGGLTYPLRGGVALETGHFPDSPNQPHFPSTLLMPGDTLQSRTVFAFSVEDTDPVARAQAEPAFRVFLLLGQSNMAGFSKALPEDKATDPRILALGFDDCPEAARTEGEWSVAMPPLHECWNGALGPGDVFAKAMLARYPAADRIGLVPLALSGKPVETFMKGPDSQYQWILERARAAQAAGGVIEGMLYHQGESNCGEADWPQKVAQFVTDLRQDLGVGDIPFLAGELLYSGDCAQQNALVRQIPDLLANAHVVSAEGLVMAERDPWKVHFSRESEIELGKRFADSMQAVLGLDAAPK